LPTKDCVCGQQSGRICLAHPNNPVEFRTISGPPLPPGTEIPWVDPKDYGRLDRDWENQIAARAEHDGTGPDRDAAAAAEALVASMQGPEFHKAVDACSQ
jgi:hypothetical protein